MTRKRKYPVVGGEFPKYKKRRMSIFSLSSEILDMIVSYLGPSHQFIMKRVCTLFYAIVTANLTHQNYRRHLMRNSIIPSLVDYEPCGYNPLEEPFDGICGIGGLIKTSVITQDTCLAKVNYNIKQNYRFFAWIDHNGYLTEVGRSGTLSTISKTIEENGGHKRDILFGIVLRGDTDLFMNFVEQYSIVLDADCWLDLLLAAIMGRNIEILKMAHKGLETKFLAALSDPKVGEILQKTLSNCIFVITHTRNAAMILGELSTWEWETETRIIAGSNFDSTFITRYDKEEHRDLIPILMESFYVSAKQIAEWILIDISNKPDYELATSLVARGFDLDFENLILDRVDNFVFDEVHIVIYCLENMSEDDVEDMFSMPSKVFRYFIYSASLEGMEYLVKIERETWSRLFEETFKHFFRKYEHYEKVYNNRGTGTLDMLKCIKHCFYHAKQSYQKRALELLLCNTEWIEQDSQVILFGHQLVELKNWIGSLVKVV